MKPCLTLPHTRGPNVSKCFAQTALLCLLSLAGARAQTNTSCAPQPQGLVGWWPAEGNANDIASGDNGTLAAGTTFAPGEVGQAFSLNGTNAFVQAPSTPALDPTTAGSMAAWVYFNQLPSVAGHDMEVIAKGGNGTDFEILADTSDSFHFFIAAGTRVDSATV